MTPDFADQEAERIITGLAWTYKPFLEKEIAEALRKAYERGEQSEFERMSKACDIEQKERYKHGFNAAREMAAKVAHNEWREHPYPRLEDPSENAELTSLRIRDAIRALKPEGE